MEGALCCCSPHNHVITPSPTYPSNHDPAPSLLASAIRQTSFLDNFIYKPDHISVDDTAHVAVGQRRFHPQQKGCLVSTREWTPYGCFRPITRPVCPDVVDPAPESSASCPAAHYATPFSLKQWNNLLYSSNRELIRFKLCMRPGSL